MKRGSIYLTDQQIEDLLGEPKALLRPLRMRDRAGHRVFDTDAAGRLNRFRVVARQSLDAPDEDFSVILIYCPAHTSSEFTLCRFNGCSHPHRNKLEDERFVDQYHVHTATERYQREEMSEEGFAVPTDDYNDLEGAWRAMLKRCGFADVPPTQLSLFDE